MGNDSVDKSIVFHLEGPVKVALNNDKETGSATYSIAIVPDEAAAVEDNDSHLIIKELYCLESLQVQFQHGRYTNLSSSHRTLRIMNFVVNLDIESGETIGLITDVMD